MTKKHMNNDLDLDLHEGNADDAIRVDDMRGPTQHKDLGQIEITELDGITINRTRGKISPFVPIIKTPNYAENSGNLTGYSVEIEDPEEQTGYRHLGNVSASYLLLTNEEVRELALEIAVQSGLPFRESRLFWDGARFAHVIDFLEREAVEEGDEVGLSLITRSSYDKSWRYECALMGKRFLCDNGALSGEFFARVSFKHIDGGSTGGGDGDGSNGHAEGWKEIVRQGLSLIDQAPEDLHRFVAGLRRLKRQPMSDAHLRALWKRLPGIGDSIMGQIMSRYVEEEEGSLYGLFNAGTYVFWNGRRMKASDFGHNDTFTTELLSYAFEQLN